MTERISTVSADAIAPNRAASPATDLALVAVFAALAAVFSLTPAIPVGALGVPITLQVLAVILAGLILGPVRGFLAIALWLLVGFAGLPVFANGGAGLGMFAKPSIGYLLSFPFGAALAGLLAVATGRRRGARWAWLLVSALAASVLIHLAGILGMSVVGKIDLAKAAFVDLAYVPGDIVKDVVAALIAAQVFRAFPALLRRR